MGSVVKIFLTLIDKYFPKDKKFAYILQEKLSIPRAAPSLNKKKNDLKKKKKKLFDIACTRSDSN